MQSKLCILTIFAMLNVTCAARDYANIFFNMSRSFNNSNSTAALPAIHLVRIPKASSTSLSAIARKLVGCSPPGPCCHYPGDPPGSCPSRDLFACEQKLKVIGCTRHYPNYKYMLSPNILSISMVRDPISRSISSFFYGGSHHNEHCRGTMDFCFKDFTKQLNWKNVAVKMLSGSYSYSVDNTCLRKVNCSNSFELARSNLNRFVFVGISELWELSILMIHKLIPQFHPDLFEFSVSGLGGGGRRLAVASSSQRGQATLTKLKEMVVLPTNNKTAAQLLRNSVNTRSKRPSKAPSVRNSVERARSSSNNAYSSETGLSLLISHIGSGDVLQWSEPLDSLENFGNIATRRSEFFSLVERMANASYQDSSMNETMMDTVLDEDVGVVKAHMANPLAQGRKNLDGFYAGFKQYARKKYYDELLRQNNLDILLYMATLDRFCNQLHVTGLWSFAIVRTYWRDKGFTTRNCSEV